MSACSLLVQVVNLVTNRVARLLGKVENTERFLRVALYQVSNCCVECSCKSTGLLACHAPAVAEGGNLTPVLLSRSSILTCPSPPSPYDSCSSSTLLSAAGGRLQAAGKIGAARQQVGRAGPAAADVRLQ